MSLRLVEIFHQKGNPDDLKFLLQDVPIYEFWVDTLPNGRINVRLLLSARDVDKVIDVFKSFFKDQDHYRIVVLPVDASVPRVKEEHQEETAGNGDEDEDEKTPTDGIGIEELYQKISPSALLTKQFVSLAILSSIVAAIGLLKDDVAVIIGSMVIAPLLGPFVGLALASVMGDFDLMKKSLATVMAGGLIAVTIGWISGTFAPLNMALSNEVLSRAQLDFLFILLAITSGIAGAYSLAQDMAEALVGVMMAVSILPPLVASGIMLSKALYIQASAAFILFLINAVCINLSGVITFAASGIRPMKVWEAKKAKRAFVYSVIILIACLALLALAISVEQRLATQL
ncbi:MAG: TIGR00341 family protein [Thermodesulfobacteria bacterium]|nr:TIGR00341 family protein [Thermodesulfobacteriota bacterium]